MDYFGPFAWIDSTYKNVKHEGPYDDTVLDFMDEMCWNQEWDIESLKESLVSDGILDVLDLGCGDGRIIHQLLESGVNHRYCGIDISNAAYKAYLKRSSLHNFHFEYMCGDFFNFKFNKKFDTIYIGSVSINGFPSFKMLGDMFSVSRNILNPGGKVVVSAYPRESERRLCTLDGVISAEPYVNSSGLYQLMWRGLKYEAPYLLQNFFCEHGSSGKPTLVSSRERIWVDEEIIDFAQTLGWSCGEKLYSYVGDGGAEGYKVSTFSLVL